MPRPNRNGDSVIKDHCLFNSLVEARGLGPRCAHDISWEYVRAALSPIEIQSKGICRSLGQSRLCRPRQSFKQNMSLRKKRGDEVLDRVCLANHDSRTLRDNQADVSSFFWVHISLG